MLAIVLSLCHVLVVAGVVLQPNSGLHAQLFAQQRKSEIPSYTLHDGYQMPVIGFGTYRIDPGNDTYETVTMALEEGYRMFDTAEAYDNEADVGQAIRDFGIPRSQVFVQTKIAPWNHGGSKALEAGRQSNAALGLGYIDSLILHAPVGGKIVETYDALVQLRAEGVTKSIGVSNFNVTHLEALATHCRPTPVVNQFEMHPLIYNERLELVEYCRSHGILVQAYGSVLSGEQDLLALAEPIAAAHGKTAAQVMLRWALEQGFQIIPKSTHREYMAENLDVFDFGLTPTEMDSLNSLPGKLDEYWNPLGVPVDLGDVGPPRSC